MTKFATGGQKVSKIQAPKFKQYQNIKRPNTQTAVLKLKNWNFKFI